MKAKFPSLQKSLFNLYRWRWPVIVALLWGTTAFEASGRFVFVGALSALVLFFFFYKKTFKKYTCVVCKGKGSLSRKNTWVLGTSGTCYSCNGQGTVNKTNYNELIKYAQEKRKETFGQMRKLNKEIKELQKNISYNKDHLKPSTLKLVQNKIGAYQKQVDFREKVLKYLDSTEDNIHKILANIHMLKKVQAADSHLKENYLEGSESDFKELFTRQGRLEYDLSRLEGELYSLETHLNAAGEEADISNELNAEMDQLMAQMKRLLKE